MHWFPAPRNLLVLGPLLVACSPANPTAAPGHESSAGTSSAAGAATAGSSTNSGGAGAVAGSGTTAGSANGGSSATPTAGAPSAGNGGANAGGVANGGGGGMATGGAASSPCGNASIFCTDFEADALAPQLLFYPEYLRATQTFVTLDSAVFHGGKRALKVSGTSYSQMLGLTVPSKFWGRVYLRSDTDIQEGHDTYVTAGTGTGDPNDGTYIRIGEHECQLELNRNTDDKELLSNGGQYTCDGGVKLLKDTWYCLEFYFDGPGQETRVLVDGVDVPALHTTDWAALDYKIFKLGFEQYGGAAKTLWYDDLAIAGEQVHCL